MATCVYITGPNKVYYLLCYIIVHFVTVFFCMQMNKKNKQIKDILTEDGTFFEFSDLKQLFKIKRTYLDYKKTCQKRGVIKLIIKR